MESNRVVAKIGYADLVIEDHGFLVLDVRFEWDGSGQGLGGYFADPSFIYGVLQAVGVDAVSKLKGKSCWITQTHDHISALEPLHKREGKPFIIAEWQQWMKGRVGLLSANDYMNAWRPQSVKS